MLNRQKIEKMDFLKITDKYDRNVNCNIVDVETVIIQKLSVIKLCIRVD